MARFVETIDLPVPVEAAFSFLADFSHTAAWDPGVAHAELLTAGAVGLGSRFRVEARFLGRRLPLEYEITAFDPPSRVVLEGGDGSLVSRDEITFAPREGGTRVTYEARLELSGLRRLADPLLALAFQFVGRNAVRGLERYAANGLAPSRAGTPPRRRTRAKAVRSVATLALGMLLLAPAAQASRSVEGVEFPLAREWAGTQLDLRGVGLLRYRAVFRAYVAALYLGENADPTDALGDVSRRIEIQYFWPIPAEAFAKATREGVRRNVEPTTLDRLRDRLERLGSLYVDVEPGDRYALTYVPGRGTELALNGEPLGSIEGDDFARAVFAIWLGENPLDASLKEDLLAWK